MDWLTGVKNFLIKSFWRPIARESVYYNPVNTLVYAVLFGLAAVKLVFPLIKKLGLEVDRNFIVGITPYIFLGGAVRSINDEEIIRSFLLETPFIYFLLFFATLFLLLIAIKLQHKGLIEYYKTWSISGSFILLGVLSLFTFSSIIPLIQVLGLFSFLSITLFLAVTAVKPELSRPDFLLPVVAHFFDGASSFVSVSMGGKEEHVLGQFMVNFLGPVGLLVMKTGIILPVTYLIWQDFEGERKIYYLLLVALLGFALGTRNLISMIA